MQKEEAFEILLALIRVQIAGLLSVVYAGFARFLKVINSRCFLGFSYIKHSPFNLVNAIAL